MVKTHGFPVNFPQQNQSSDSTGSVHPNGPKVQAIPGVAFSSCTATALQLAARIARGFNLHPDRLRETGSCGLSLSGETTTAIDGVFLGPMENWLCSTSM